MPRKALLGSVACFAGSRAGGIEPLVSQATVEARVWIDGREYTDEKTIQQLAEEAEARGQH
jgi:hypothetical protein